MTSVLAFLAATLATVALAELAPRRPRSATGLVTRLGARTNLRATRGLAARIEAAGLDRGTHEVVALQAGLAILTTLVSLPLITAAPGRLGPALLLGAPLAGFALPELGLRKRTQRRRRQIEAELPDVLDLLRVAIAAGLAPRRALREVGRRHPGTLARELARFAARTALGEPVEDALDHLQRRCPSHTIPPFVAALRRAERHGTPLGPTLQAQAAEARSRRAARRMEQAAKAAPKIQLVVALLLVPAVLLLIAAALVPTLGA
jgi:tight adherence protein C